MACSTSWCRVSFACQWLAFASILALAILGADAASECQIKLVVSDPSKRFPWAVNNISCVGDPVDFWVGNDVDVPDADRGSANISKFDSKFGVVEVHNATDVTFTCVEIRLYEYIDPAALTLIGCTRCTLRDVIFDDIRFAQLLGGGVAIGLVDSDVTLRDAVFQSLGQDGLSGMAISASNSKLDMHNVSFVNSTMAHGVASVQVYGGELAATGCTWQNLSYTTEQPGTVVVAGSEASVTLQDVTVVGCGGAEAMVSVTTGARVDIQPTCRVFLPSDGEEVVKSTLGAGQVVQADNTTGVWFDGGASLWRGTPKAPERLQNLAAVLAGPSVVITNVGLRVELNVRNVRINLLGGIGVRLEEQLVVQLRDVPLLGLSVTAARVQLRRVNFTQLVGVRSPVVEATNAALSFTDCRFGPIAVYDDDARALPGAALSLVSSSASVTRCTFRNITWGSRNTASAVLATESAVARADTGSRLRIVNSYFTAVGGCGTAIWATSGSVLELTRVNVTDISLSGSQGEQRATVVVTAGSSLTAMHSSWRRINAGSSSNGAALTVIDAASLQLSGCTFADVSALSSPGLQILAPEGRTSSEVQVTGCIFERMTATSALLVSDASVAVRVHDTRFQGCTSGGMDTSPLTLHNCAAGSPAVELDGVRFEGNFANVGAAVQSSGCTVVVRNSTFTNNTAAYYGGALYANGRASRFILRECTFVANIAGLYGGAVCGVSGSALMLDTCTLVANGVTNSSGLGGGVASINSFLQVVNSTFTRNTVKGRSGAGGAVGCQNATTAVVVSGSTFFANLAQTSYGGALYFDRCPAQVEDSLLIGNTALRGGGVYVTDNGGSIGTPVGRFLVPPSASPLFLPDADQYGSELPALFNNSYIRLVSSTFTQNSCPDELSSEGIGGAVYSARELYVESCTFLGNICVEGAAMGVVRVQSNESVVVVGSTFTGNRATGSGGAVSLWSTRSTVAFALLYGNRFEDNMARTVAGALQANSGWAMYLGRNVFEANGNPDTKLRGGAVHATGCANLPSDPEGAANVYMQLNNFTRNTADTGGAVSLLACNVTVLGDRYEHNKAGSDGGAFYAVNINQSPLSTLQLVDVYAEHNSAVNSGGAVYVLSQGLTATGCTFQENSARVAGGAIAGNEVSPMALLILERTTDPYYSSKEQDFLKMVVTSSNFTRNSADLGGGGIYLASSSLDVSNSNFTANAAGDGIYNDEWSDSGGAIFAAGCFGLCHVVGCQFENNTATGGPGGAVLHVSCSFIFQYCDLMGNNASTYGGAIGAGERLRAESNWSSTPQMVMINCNLYDNAAILSDGGAVLLREVNASFFMTSFRRNQAGGSGGAVSSWSSVSCTVLRGEFEANRAQQSGGALHLRTTPVVSVVSSAFRSNHARLSGGAMSALSYNCTLLADVLYDGNWVDSRGGAVHLQPTTDGAGDDVNSAAASGQCVGFFLRDIRQHISPKGLELLGISESVVTSYNATVVYDGTSVGRPSASLSQSGGIRLEVVNITGPPQIANLDLQIAPAATTRITLAPRSALVAANWANLRLTAEPLYGTRLVTAYDTAGRPALTTGAAASASTLPASTRISLGASSAITRLTSGMSLRPIGDVLNVLDSGWYFIDGSSLAVGSDLPALSLPLGVRASVSLPTGAGTTAASVTDWNRFLVYTTAATGTLLLDSLTGDTQRLEPYTVVSLGAVSPVLKHPRTVTELQPSNGTLVVVGPQGSWTVGPAGASEPGTQRRTLTPGGSTVALTVIPAAGSSVKVAAGSEVTIPGWPHFVVEVSSAGIALRRASSSASGGNSGGSDSGAALPPGAVLLLAAGSSYTRLNRYAALLLGPTRIEVQGSLWYLDNGTWVDSGSGGLAVTLVVPTGGIVHLAAIDSTETEVEATRPPVLVEYESRYVVWAGPRGTILYDMVAGMAMALPDQTIVQLPDTSCVTKHEGTSALLLEGLSFLVQGASWRLSNGTTLVTGGSVAGLTAMAAAQSSVQSGGDDGGTAVKIKEYYRFTFFAGRDASYIYDTSSGEVTRLVDGTTVTLGRGSIVLSHDSLRTTFPTDVVAVVQGTELVLQGSGGDNDVRGDGAIVSSARAPSVILVPATDSRILLGNSTTVREPNNSRYALWSSQNGSVLYDSWLGASYRLVDGSQANLAPDSFLMSHDSGTKVLATADTIALKGDGSGWELEGSGQSYSIGGGTVAVAASPAALSSIQFSDPWVIDVASWESSAGSYVLWGGLRGAMLSDRSREAVYRLAEGSKVVLAAGSSIVVGKASEALTTEMSLQVLAGGGWQLQNGTTIIPGSGNGMTGDSNTELYTPYFTKAEGELEQTCSVDFLASDAVYERDPFVYDYYAVQAYLASLFRMTNSSQPNIAPALARAAYGYPASQDTSGFNASLLVPEFAFLAWDEPGRPSSARVTCVATVATSGSSLARGLSTLLLNSTFTNNRAGAKGGAVFLSGGTGRVLVDNLQLTNNSVVGGDGGGLALFQDDAALGMRLEVSIVRTNFTFNKAASGFGGGVSLAAFDVHQQVVFINCTLDSNFASAGGGLMLFKHVSVLLNDSLLSNNVADAAAIGDGRDRAGDTIKSDVGAGGGIMASLCNELQLNGGTRLIGNTASGRGGGLAAVECTVTLVNGTSLQGNTAQSGGGAYIRNALELVPPTTALDRLRWLSREDTIGASIAVVLKSDFLGNKAADTTTTNDSLVTYSEGIGGAILVRGHVSALLADSYFEGNVAALQGGSIFLQSSCDLEDDSLFLLRNSLFPVTAFPGATSLLGGTVHALQSPRPKGCWGTVIYMPRFVNNEAARSGGALFASHPEALSLVCAGDDGYDIGVDLQLDFATFNETLLANRVLLAMMKASYQVLDNRIVQSCYRNEIQQIYNKSLDQLDLTGTQLSTLNISDNRAKGYGYLIAIMPSKLRIINVSWTGNATVVVPEDPGRLLQAQLDGAIAAPFSEAATASRRSQLSIGRGGSSDTGGSGPDTTAADGSAGAGAVGSQLPMTLADGPFFRAAPSWVFDNDTQALRQIVTYHVTTTSNKPMDLPVLLLDALDQIASENTMLRQADVHVHFLRSLNGCEADLLGGVDGVARNGTAVMNGLRLRAPKGVNYSIIFQVRDSIFSGTVEPLLVNVTVPPCAIGEVPRDEGHVCQKCDPRSFSLWQDTEPLVNCTYDNLQDITCLPCPDGAECPGGAVVVPRSGLWHSAANSTFMNACPNPEACRDGNDDAQNMLVTCQQWWYSRPDGFDHQTYVDRVLAGEGEAFMTAPGAPSALYNLSDPSVCVLWGLPYDHPLSYMKKQCAEGYRGNLCGVCASVDGVAYAGQGDFSCGECFGRTTSVVIAVLGFLANVATVLFTVVVTFMTDYTEDEELAMGDLLKVLIVHAQFFIIVTRLNIDWPDSVSFVTSLMSSFTGAVTKVYSPSCMLGPDATPSEMARVNQLAALLTPLVVVLCIAGLWMLFRWCMRAHLGRTALRERSLDMRTIDEYRADRLKRLAAKRQLARQQSVQVGVSQDSNSPFAKFFDFGSDDDYDKDLDLRADTLLPRARLEGAAGAGAANEGGGPAGRPPLAGVASQQPMSWTSPGLPRNLGGGSGYGDDRPQHMSLVIREEGLQVLAEEEDGGEDADGHDESEPGGRVNSMSGQAGSRKKLPHVSSRAMKVDTMGRRKEGRETEGERDKQGRDGGETRREEEEEEEESTAASSGQEAATPKAETTASEEVSRRGIRAKGPYVVAHATEPEAARMQGSATDDASDTSGRPSRTVPSGPLLRISTNGTGRMSSESGAANNNVTESWLTPLRSAELVLPTPPNDVYDLVGGGATHPASHGAAARMPPPPPAPLPPPPAPPALTPGSDAEGPDANGNAIATTTTTGSAATASPGEPEAPGPSGGAGCDPAGRSFPEGILLKSPSGSRAVSGTQRSFLRRGGRVSFREEVQADDARHSARLLHHQESQRQQHQQHQQPHRYSDTGMSCTSPSGLQRFRPPRLVLDAPPAAAAPPGLKKPPPAADVGSGGAVTPRYVPGTMSADGSSGGFRRHTLPGATGVARVPLTDEIQPSDDPASASGPGSSRRQGAGIGRWTSGDGGAKDGGMNSPEWEGSRERYSTGNLPHEGGPAGALAGRVRPGQDTRGRQNSLQRDGDGGNGGLQASASRELAGSLQQEGEVGKSPVQEGSFRQNVSGGHATPPTGDGKDMGSQVPSWRQQTSKVAAWLSKFFTYDEENADGEVRWASLATIHRTMAWWRQELLVLMIAGFVLYPAWAQATLQIFACYFLDDGSGYYPEYQLAQWGRGYWLLNMNQECYTGEHAHVWVPIGIVCVIVICLGIPLLTFMVTWTHRTALHTVHVTQTYGFLYRRYDYDTFYWWEAAMQAQTLLLVVVEVFGRVLVVYQQAVLLMIALLLIMWCNTYFQPLQHKLLERMSSLSLVVLSFTVALGLFFVPPSDRKDPVTPAAAAAIGGVIVALNLALIIYFVYVMWTHGREALKCNVAAVREGMAVATTRVQTSLASVRHQMYRGASNLRSVTSHSLTQLFATVSTMRGKMQSMRQGHSHLEVPVLPVPSPLYTQETSQPPVLP